MRNNIYGRLSGRISYFICLDKLFISGSPYQRSGYCILLVCPALGEPFLLDSYILISCFRCALQTIHERLCVLTAVGWQWNRHPPPFSFTQTSVFEEGKFSSPSRVKCTHIFPQHLIYCFFLSAFVACLTSFSGFGRDASLLPALGDCV